MKYSTPPGYECTPECWNWIGRSGVDRPAWIYLAFSFDLYIGDEAYGQVREPASCEFLKVGKAEGCLDCRIKELNGVLSPRLLEKQRRGDKVVAHGPWCGVTGWHLWGKRPVTMATESVAEKHKFVRSVETEHGEKFTRIATQHLPKPNGEIFAIELWEEIEEYLSDVIVAHDDGDFDSEEFHECSKDALRMSYFALAEFLCRWLEMELGPGLALPSDTQERLDRRCGLTHGSGAERHSPNDIIETFSRELVDPFA